MEGKERVLVVNQFVELLVGKKHKITEARKA